MAANESASCGLDTSVVLRLLVGEPAPQAAVAKAFVEDSASAGRRLLISDLVIVEAYFALHSHYKVPKKRALEALFQLLDSGVVDSLPGDVAREVLKATLGASNQVGFADRMIHGRYRSAAARMATFERAAGRLDGSEVLKE